MQHLFRCKYLFDLKLGVHTLLYCVLVGERLKISRMHPLEKSFKLKISPEMSSYIREKQKCLNFYKCRDLT